MGTGYIIAQKKQKEQRERGEEGSANAKGGKKLPVYATGGQGNTSRKDDIWSQSEVDKSNGPGEGYEFKPIKDQPGNYERVKKSTTSGASGVRRGGGGGRRAGGGGRNNNAGASNMSSEEGPFAETVVREEVDVAELQPPSDIGLDVEQTAEDLSTISQTFADTTSALAADADRIRKLSESYLSGEIPAEVQGQIRRMTSERGIASGIGRGQAGQALTARDLGITSLQLQESGVSMRQAAAAINQTLAGITEGRRQFDKAYELDSAKLMEDVRRGDLNFIQIEQARRQFNAQQNLKLVEMVGTLAADRARVQYSLASADIDDKNVIQGFDNVISQLDALIKKSTGAV